MNYERIHRDVENALRANEGHRVKDILKDLNLTKCAGKDQSFLQYCVGLQSFNKTNAYVRAVARAVFAHASNHDLLRDPMVEISPMHCLPWTQWVFHSDDHLELIGSPTVRTNMPDKLLVDLLDAHKGGKQDNLGRVVRDLVERGIAHEDFHRLMLDSSPNLFVRAEFFEISFDFNRPFVLSILQEQGLSITQLQPVKAGLHAFFDVLCKHLGIAQDKDMAMTWPALLSVVGDFQFAAVMVAQLEDPLMPVLVAGDKSYHLLDVLNAIEMTAAAVHVSIHELHSCIQSRCSQLEARKALQDIRGALALP